MIKMERSIRHKWVKEILYLAESQPVLATHMYAFRFYDSRKMILRCEVQLCPNGESSDCDMVSNSTAALPQW